MNARDRKMIVEIAKASNYGDEFSVLSGDLADQIHSTPKGSIYTDSRHAGALVKWQALQFDGEWDLNGLNEVFDFMSRVIIVDIQSAYTTAVKVLAQRGTKPLSVKKVPSPDYSDARFSNVEF